MSSPPGAPRILLLAGEASGDEYAAALARTLRERWPGVRLTGTGGPRMAAEEVQLLAELDRLAVMGVAEVVRRLVFFRGLLRAVIRRLEAREFDLVILVDYPGFNLRVARAASRFQVPVLYYVAPKVWASRAGRVRQLARHVRHVAVVLPFERRILEEAGATASFVGHPLLDRSPLEAPREAFCAEVGLDPRRPILALLPGSRRHEVRHHLDRFVDAAVQARRACPDLQPVLARAPAIPHEWLASSGLPVTGNARALLRHARAALLKSGTSTLEAALEGTPSVVAYRTDPVTFALARLLVRVPFIALPNLIAGERVVPELLQGAVTNTALASHLIPLLSDTPQRARQLRGLARVRGALGTPGVSVRVAEIAAAILEERP